MKFIFSLLLLGTSSFVLAQSSVPATNPGANVIATNPGANVTPANAGLDLTPASAVASVTAASAVASVTAASAVASVSATSAGANITVPQNGVSGNAISACGVISSPGNYYLTQDLNCPGTGLLVVGGGINLNLNGHTIVYGTAGGQLGSVYGIENDACWDTNHKAQTVPCDTTGQPVNVEIYGGRVVQSTNAPAFTHGLFFGENANATGTINIHDLTVTVQQTGSSGFYSNFQHGQIVLQHNTIYDNTKAIEYPGQSTISARDEFQGEAIHVNNSTGMVAPDQIGYNKIVGSPQGGIRDTSYSAQVYGNDISMNSTYANDFCVDVPGKYERIFSNNCHPVNGRGIHINSEGSWAYYNTITVTEAPVNTEYSGCEGGGAYAVQVEDDIQHAGHVVVYANTGTLNTGACGGADLRITGWHGGSLAQVAKNSWTVNTTGGANKYGGFVYSFDNADLSNAIFDGGYGPDSMTTSGPSCVVFDWDGVQNFSASLPYCHAQYTLYARNSNYAASTFNIWNTPDPQMVCWQHSATQGLMNGSTMKCPD